jgi:hypothetical protein
MTKDGREGNDGTSSHLLGPEFVYILLIFFLERSDIINARLLLNNIILDLIYILL